MVKLVRKDEPGKGTESGTVRAERLGLDRTDLREMREFVLEVGQVGKDMVDSSWPQRRRQKRG